MSAKETAKTVYRELRERGKKPMKNKNSVIGRLVTVCLGVLLISWSVMVCPAAAESLLTCEEPISKEVKPSKSYEVTAKQFEITNKASEAVAKYMLQWSEILMIQEMGYHKHHTGQRPLARKLEVTNLGSGKQGTLIVETCPGKA